MAKCNEKNMRKWIDALRSGRYQQGGYALKRTSYDMPGSRVAYCADGVAVAEAIKDGIAAEYSHIHMPPIVLQWLGISSRLFAAEGICVPVTAPYLNDHLHWSFSRIADALEAYYLTPEEAIDVPDDARELTDQLVAA